MTSKRRAPGALAALRRDLRRLPEELRDGVEAACALQLARSIDAGEFVVAASKQLATLMTSLRSRAKTMAPVAPPVPTTASAKESPVADLTSRIAAARRGGTAG